MVHASKKDWWLVGFVGLGGLVPGVAGVSHLVTRGPDATAWVALAVAAGYAVAVFALACPVSYEIAPPDLVIRSGLLRHTIPLASIEGMRPSRNPLSAPAWSLDRLRIDYRKDDKRTFALVSPENRSGFLRELVASTPGLALEGTRVVRVPGRGTIRRPRRHPS